MSNTVHRGQRLLALALAATTVGVSVLATAASAQASTSTTHNYTGSADSSALQLVVALPAPLAGPLGAVLPNPIDLSLIRSTGQASHDGKTADVATSVAQLAQGGLLSSGAIGAALSQALGRSVTASLASPNPASVSLGALPPNPLNLNLAVGPLSASSNTRTKATQGSGILGAGSLGSLSALAPQLTVPLQTTFTQLTAALTTATQALSTVTGGATSGATALDPVIAAVNGGLAPVSIPATGVSGIPQTVPAIPLPSATAAGLVTTINQLPALLNSVVDQLLNGAVLSLGAVGSTEGITPVAAGTTSTGSTNTGDIALLGGLVNVVASKANATATATGTPGKSTASATATLVQVSLSTALTNLLNVSASDQGITTQLVTNLGADPVANAALLTVVQPVNVAVNAIFTQVLALLQMLNSDVKVLQKGTTSTSNSTDGTHSEAHATPAQVIVGLPGATNLVALSLGKVDVVANQRNVRTAAEAVSIPRKRATPKAVAPTTRLAYTGGDLPLTAGAALVLLGAGGVLARRRRRPADEV